MSRIESAAIIDSVYGLRQRGFVDQKCLNWSAVRVLEGERGLAESLLQARQARLVRRRADHRPESHRPG
jgi:hypothetical protein